mmetsp:Transcript_5429/g.8409  ORF Transcript_5429/g.8409 Transcript_5429/m.8409 type:complete len:345 (+) Transcript_5429:279-1313(+)|eukprot:CAMPEP_0203745540 /NCGR_PEP_ID=MMETSP0098-20131031/1237_1 /ASSEMBLY_ACC=CAM_ASM_000208 /TAXON_ID=96639 /ORGANISM=" , Strain NY0313808BC1" /LENGTH=344 /DNA_ID=CAMNT_0050633339 /DNA_START=319 /DNA_END=1353 /DNA_ORIENTATION=-
MVTALSGDMERALLHQDLAKDKGSDEEGAKARVEFDSDFSESEEEENAPPEEPDPFADRPNWSKVLTKNRAKHNTGPKGVKADYEEAKLIQRRRNETKKLIDLELYKRAAYGSTTTDASISLNANPDIVAGVHLQKYDADEEDNSDDSDDEFLNAYRQQRMSQLESMAKQAQFGRVLYVDKFGFLDEVDNAPPYTFVVTHIYEEYINACKRMNTILDQFAAKHPHVKVLKLIATDAKQTLSHRALPAFLVYRNQELVSESSVAVHESEFGTTDFGLEEVEWFFTRDYGIPLAGVDVAESEKGRKSNDSGIADAWQPSQSQTLGRVNLLGNRLTRGCKIDDDDDW